MTEDEGLGPHQPRVFRGTPHTWAARGGVSDLVAAPVLVGSFPKGPGVDVSEHRLS